MNLISHIRIAISTMGSNYYNNIINKFHTQISIYVKYTYHLRLVPLGHTFSPRGYGSSKPNPLHSTRLLSRSYNSSICTYAQLDEFPPRIV